MKKFIQNILDTGIGESQLQNLYSSPTSKHKHFTGIGIKAVDDRIKPLYGNNYV